jgi:hypothetical protein
MSIVTLTPALPLCSHNNDNINYEGDNGLMRKTLAIKQACSKAALTLIHRLPVHQVSSLCLFILVSESFASALIAA